MAVGESENGRESHSAAFASIESGDEFVEVGTEMLAAQVAINAKRPRLQVRDHAMHGGQNDIGGHGVDNMGPLVHAR